MSIKSFIYWPSTCLVICLILYFGVSKYVFDFVYATSQSVVDEEYHLPLGKHYCKFEFSIWDNKVTTLPGLYLITAAILGPFELCSVYYLRSISFGAAMVNIVLFYLILRHYEPQAVTSNIVSTFNMGLLPPLYFFSHLYYTDVLSLTLVLLTLYTHLKRWHFVTAIFGFLSVIMRQTNVVWVAMLGGKFLLTQIFVNTFQENRKVQKRRFVISEKNIFELTRIYKRGWLDAVKVTTFLSWLNFLCYVVVIICFIAFVIFNGGIVVGDKSAHQATIHVPQVFYFSLFSLVFAWPLFMSEISNCISFMFKRKTLFGVLFFISGLIVYFNTLVHPYLLADNRHYMFYIWNRFYGKFSWFRYKVIPIYFFAFYGMVKWMWRTVDISFPLVFVPTAIVFLSSQKLLEFRYFFIPYIFFRLHVRNVRLAFAVCEFLTAIALNVITLGIFFDKRIQWADFEDPQRIIW